MSESDSIPAVVTTPNAIQLQDLSLLTEPSLASSPDLLTKFKDWYSLDMTATSLYCTAWPAPNREDLLRVIKFDHEGVYKSHVDLTLTGGVKFVEQISVRDDLIFLIGCYEDSVMDAEVFKYYLFTHLGFCVAMWQSGTGDRAESDFAPNVIRADFLRPDGRWDECLYRVTPTPPGMASLPWVTWDHVVTTWNIADLIATLNDAGHSNLSEIHSLTSENKRLYQFPFPSSIEYDREGLILTFSDWTTSRSDTSGLWFLGENRCWSLGESSAMSPQLHSIDLPDLRYLRSQQGFQHFFEGIQELTYGGEALATNSLWISSALLKKNTDELALLAFRIEEGIGVLQAVAVPSQIMGLSVSSRDLLAVNVYGLIGHRALVTIWGSICTFDTILGDFQPFSLQVPSALLSS